jgi:hypothetical protein
VQGADLDAARGERARDRGWPFRILWAFDFLIALVALYFFFAGLADGSVSSFNAGLWSLVLLGLGIVVLGGLALRSAGYPGLAYAALLTLAVPGAAFVLYFLALVLSGPTWH